jgi:hypothetical protein
MQSQCVLSCLESIQESIAHGWAVMTIRVSTIRVLAVALSSDVVLPPRIHVGGFLSSISSHPLAVAGPPQFII